MHAQLKIGDSVLMLAGEFPLHAPSPKSRGGTSVYLHIYLANAKAYSKVIMRVSDMFWGDHYGVVEDPFGHQWSIATHKHNFTPKQVAANAKEFMATR